MTAVRKTVCLLLLALTLLTGALFAFRPSEAMAETASDISGNVEYTDVMTDLTKDPNFNQDEYPDKPGDYSIQVIQIAEGVRGELFIYVYQPCRKTVELNATEINMSLSESVDSTRLYGLTLLNSSGVFCKYKVNEVIVSSDRIRYYNITSIFRPRIDQDEYDDTVKSVSIPVNQLWTLKMAEAGKTSYECKISSSIEITSRYDKFMRYFNQDFHFGAFEQDYFFDRFYVAFSTDKKIDDLVSVEISFVESDRTVAMINNICEDGFVDGKDISRHITISKEDLYSPLKYEHKGEYDRVLSWKGIEKTSEFIDNNKLDTSVKTELNKYSWVISFFGAEYKFVRVSTNLVSTIVANGRAPREVTILRLNFVSDNKTYNLGVIDNKVTGEYDYPDNFDRPIQVEDRGSLWDRFWSSFKGFWADVKDFFKGLFSGGSHWWILVLVLLIIAVALPILSIFFPVVGNVILFVLKGLWWLISAPFRFIAWVFRCIFGRDKGDS